MRAKVIVMMPVLNKYPQEVVASLNSQTMKPERIIVVAGTIKVHEECKKKGIESIFVRPKY